MNNSLGSLPSDRIKQLWVRLESQACFVPEPGDVIYVHSAFYIDHGWDDVAGGLALVTECQPGVSAGETVPFVNVAQHPGRKYNWKILFEKQRELWQLFGETIACQDPDCR